MSNAIVINDVPEIKKEETVKIILKLIVSLKAFSTAQSDNPHIISVSQVRKEIKKRLEVDIRQEKRKYDLILLCESGGTILCGGFKKKLIDLGTKINELPYSGHEPTDWQKALNEEIQQLNEKASVAIIEGDAGEIRSTSAKLNTVIGMIRQIKPSARIHVLIGVANTRAFERLPLFNTIKFSCGWKTTGHVSRFSELVRRLTGYLDEWHQTTAKNLTASQRYMTESEVYSQNRDSAMLEQIVIAHNLYTPKEKK